MVISPSSLPPLRHISPTSPPNLRQVGWVSLTNLLIHTPWLMDASAELLPSLFVSTVLGVGC